MEVTDVPTEAMLQMAQAGARKTQSLVDKARALVALLEDAEVNHGGLWGGKTMRAKDDLRLELSKWTK